MATDPNAQLGAAGTETSRRGGPGAGFSTQQNADDTEDRSLGETLFQNPLPIIAAGVGLTLLLTTLASRGRTRASELESMPGNVRRAAAQAARDTGRLAQQEVKTARRKLSSGRGRGALATIAATAVGEIARELIQARRRTPRQFDTTGLSDYVSERPVALSAIALGALAAAAIPFARSRGWLGGHETEEGSEEFW